MPNRTEAETTTGSWRRRSWRHSHALGLVVAAAALIACDSDSPDPTAPGGPEGPDPSAVTLESNELDSGGTGVVVSDGFAQLELEPAVDDDGAIIPDRWTNLRVAVADTEVDVRRLDNRTMEFSVPILPGGTYGVDVASPLAHGSVSARVFGVIASDEVMSCFMVSGPPALIPVGDGLVFDTDCSLLGGEFGVGVMWPAVPGRGFEWLPEGAMSESAPWATAGPSLRPNHFVARRSGSSEPPEFWVWEGGPNPRPVEPLDCFGTAAVNPDGMSPAEAADGSCLLISPFGGMVFRDGEPVAEWPIFGAGHFVMSDDGWLTARNTRRLFVFDPEGELVSEDDIGFIRDARFAPGGGPLFVATENPNASSTETRLLAVDRTTGDVQRETTLSGIVTAIAVSEGGLWIARATEGGFTGGELLVELLDPETLEIRRSITVSRDLAPEFGNRWPAHGLAPVLLEDATGTRVTYTGGVPDHGPLWSHVVDVGGTE